MLQPSLFALSILFTAITALPAHAGGRDGGNGPKYGNCSELESLTAQERRDHTPGQRVKCMPDRSDSGSELDQIQNEYQPKD